MKYYIIEAIGNFLMVDINRQLKTPWESSLSNLFPLDFCDSCSDPMWHGHKWHVVFELDELPSSYEEFKLMFPEYFI